MNPSVTSNSQPSVTATASAAAVDQTDSMPYAQIIKTSPTSQPISPHAPASSHSPSGEAPHSAPPSELDNMLGSLESDMKGHGVTVATKGLCGACAKPVVGQVRL